MRNDMRVEKLTRLAIGILQEERDAVMKGALGALEALNGRKAELLEQLAEMSRQLDAGGPEQLRAARRKELETLFDIIRRRSEENQFLLKAAGAGVRSAAKQVQQILNSDSSFGVYNADGRELKSNAQSRETSQLL